MSILLSLLLVVSFSLSIYFVDNGSNFFIIVLFGSLLLAFLLTFIFSEKNEKTARLIFLILYLITLSCFTYLSINSYVNVVTCERYEDYSCLARKAVKENNSSLCDLARDDGEPSESRRGWCYRELSKNWKDDSICENLKIGDVSRYAHDYRRCIANIAKNTENPLLCEKVDYNGKFSLEKGNCYKTLGQDPPVVQSTFVFTNDFHSMTFKVPDGYLISSNHYGIEDPAKAKSFFFRKKSDNYIGVPTLNADDNLKLPTDQTFDQFINSIYEVNKEEGNASTNLKKSEYGGVSAYEFGINHSYSNPNGGQLLDSLGGKVVFIYRNQKILEFLQTGHELNLSGILKSLEFK